MTDGEARDQWEAVSYYYGCDVFIVPKHNFTQYRSFVWNHIMNCPNTNGNGNKR